MTKTLSFILTLIFLCNLVIFPQQKYYTFSELKGIEDQQGNTHLFYRMYNYQKGGEIVGDYVENSIYEYDVKNHKDSLFLVDGGRVFESTITITDLKFWNNDPQKFIYCGYYVGVDPTVFIKRYDVEADLLTSFGGDNCSIELSRQNDSLIFASINYSTIKSRDRGNTWDTIPSFFDKKIVSVNPYNDSVLFFQSDNQLLKSTNQGSSFFFSDTTFVNSQSFFYDKDKNSIYRIVNSRGVNFIYVSNNNGEPFSWSIKHSSSQKLYLSVDDSQSGNIYLADGRYIYFSNDYGNSFSTFKELDRKIVGIYKKPNSDKLYAATKYDLYEIKPNSAISIKHFNIDPAVLNYYPLEIGNKWIYEIDAYGEIYTVTVAKDTLISQKLYYKLKNDHYNKNIDSHTIYFSFERIDTSSGKVYQFDSGAENEIYDFSISEVGDTIDFEFGNGLKGWFLKFQESFNQWGLNLTRRTFEILSKALGYQEYTFVKDVGLYQYLGGEVLTAQTLLKGAIINGTVYGDTNTVVGINDEKQLPENFLLSQNYPNPFNPSTKITYSIPSSPLVKGRTEVGFVTLKVYDILGNEIATLVNKQQSPGNYEVEFDAANPANGTGISSGIYFYTLTTGNFHQTKKMILLR